MRFATLVSPISRKPASVEALHDKTVRSDGLVADGRADGSLRAGERKSPDIHTSVIIAAWHQGLLTVLQQVCLAGNTPVGIGEDTLELGGTRSEVAYRRRGRQVIGGGALRHAQVNVRLQLRLSKGRRFPDFQGPPAALQDFSVGRAFDEA